MTTESDLQSDATRLSLLAMRVPVEIWRRTFSAAEAMMRRSDAHRFAASIEIIRGAPPFRPADADIAEYWLAVVTLSGGAGSPAERALELTPEQRDRFGKALLLILCWISAEVGHGTEVSAG